MNVSAGHSGGCSASIKTSVTVQHERKQTCLPSAVRDVNACRPGWDNLLIPARLPAVNRVMGSGSELSSCTRAETGWDSHALLPLFQPGACSHTHQEAATKSCSFIRGRDGTRLTFLQVLELMTKPAPPHKDVFISSGLFKEQVLSFVRDQH